MTERQTSFDTEHLPLGLAPRTVFVTGKGGVGKSTVSVALAMAWRNAGARTLLVEIEGHTSPAALCSNAEIRYEPTPIGEQLFALRITLLDALKEYARQRLKVKMVADKLVSNPIIDQFTHAAPGFRDLLVLGKLWQLSCSGDWDAIVVDSPATGHGLGLLNMAGVIARMFPVGPISTEAKQVDTFTRDKNRVGVVLVSLPEELPVTETLELKQQLTQQGINVCATVLNSLLVDRFSASEAKKLKKLLNTQELSNNKPLLHALETALFEHERCQDQSSERTRLATGISPMSLSLLPYMFAPELKREHIVSLSHWLTSSSQLLLQTQLAGAENGPAAADAVHASIGKA